MLLCDKEILEELDNGNLIIVARYHNYPFSRSQIQPSSLDLRLGNKVMAFKRDIICFDTNCMEDITDYIETRIYNENEPIIIRPHETLFAETYENICLKTTLSGRILGRSRFTRIGISVHTMYINPGFMGPVPLHIQNNNEFPVKLYPFADICQMVIYRLSKIPDQSYLEREKRPWRENYNEIYDYRLLEQELDKEGIEKNMIEIYYENTQRNNDAEYYNKLFKGGNVYMGDIYQINNAGIVGKKAGKYSYVDNVYSENGAEEPDLQRIKMEIQKVRMYIKEHYSDLDYDILVGNLSVAEKNCNEGNVKGVKENLIQGGKVLLDIAKSVGCGLIANVLSRQLGI